MSRYVIALFLLLLPLQLAAQPIVIAHRGASAYLPEHTLAAAAMAHAMQADYLELDVVMTRDGEAVVFHDLYLNAMTNVSDVFSNRARDDGRHYVADFSLAEIQTLKLHERRNTATGEQLFHSRFSAKHAIFKIPTLEAMIQLVLGLNQSSAHKIGLYVEIKAPRRHQANGLNIVSEVLNSLHQNGFESEHDKVFIQCFDAETLRTIFNENLTDIPLIQLLGENAWWPQTHTDYAFLKTPAGLAEVASYAAGIGPWLGQIILAREPNGATVFSSLVEDAKDKGLLVHPYTVRSDALPAGFIHLEPLLDALFGAQSVDGVFADHPDEVRRYIDRHDY
ncbi:MAG: glycerophosphodiester phosphodiesterase [Pseudomonadota bacterium]